jgi:hypothetical protein
MKKTFVLAHDLARVNAAKFCMDAPAGWMVVVSEPTKKRVQEEKYHAMISEIAAQVEHIGRLWDAESMKRLLVDEFADEMRMAGTPLHGDGSVMPSLDGRRIVQLGIQTRDFTVKEAAAFIEFLQAFGARHDVYFEEAAACS